MAGIRFSAMKSVISFRLLNINVSDASNAASGRVSFNFVSAFSMSAAFSDKSYRARDTMPLGVKNRGGRLILSRRRERLHSAVPDRLGSARGGQKFDQSFRTLNVSRAGNDAG